MTKRTNGPKKGKKDNPNKPAAKVMGKAAGEGGQDRRVRNGGVVDDPSGTTGLTKVELVERLAEADWRALPVEKRRFVLMIVETLFEKRLGKDAADASTEEVRRFCTRLKDEALANSDSKE